MNQLPTIMKLSIFSFFILPLAASTVLDASPNQPSGTYQEGGGIVVMEIENTASPLGQWSRIEPGNPHYVAGATGSAHLEFTGNTVAGGDPASPLMYTFKINRPGRYHLHLRGRKRLAGAEWDKCNDAYVRMSGDFSSGNEHYQRSVLSTDTKLYLPSPKKDNGASSWAWSSDLDSKVAHHKPAIYNFKAGETYTLTISGRSQRYNLDRIVLRHSSVAETIAQDPSVPESSTDPNTTVNQVGANASARPNFNSSTDILIAQFDSKPDADDVMAQAALACMLGHVDLQGAHVYAVAGAVGKQSGVYINSRTLFAMIFGAENGNWTDAKKNWRASVRRIKNKVQPILNAGGTVWVQEAGQSDITADWIAALIGEGVPETVIKKQVVVVQHSQWNEDHTHPTDLGYVQSKATYVAIDDGNANPGDYSSRGARGPETPNYVDKSVNWLKKAKAGSNPNAKARAVWTEADRIIKDSGFNARYSIIPGGGVDFSDCVEAWWIFGIGNDAKDVASFWDRYVINAPTRKSVSR
jgi:hypothetical protein